MPIANINEADLWYEVMGQGEPLLLHHGYTASRVNWMPVAERLKDRYQIILMQCRGTGESEHTQSGYEIAQYALDVVGLLDHLALERVAFAGHSMGGGIGFQLGVHHSDRLTKLILKAAIPSGGIGPYSQDLLDQQLAARARGDRAFFLNRYHQGRTLAELEDDDWFEDRVNHLMTVSDGHIAGGLETMSNLNLTAQLGDLTTPTLVIAGSGDGLLNANLQDYQRLPNADLAVLSRVGHEVAVHAPDAVAEAIDKFMSDLLKIVKRHNIWLGLISHLRKAQGGKAFEDGNIASIDDIKGSGSIKQISFDIIAFSRNLTASDEYERNTVNFRVLKSRFTGKTGDAGAATYDAQTTRLQNKEVGFDYIAT